MSKARNVGIKINSGFRKFGRGVWTGLKATGSGIKTGAVAVKEVAVGVATGRTEEEQRQLELDLKVERAERAHLDPSSKLYRDLTGTGVSTLVVDDDRR